MAIQAQPGDFDGATISARAEGPFEIRAVTVADRGQIVGRHTHEEAHFMLVLGGIYLCSIGGRIEALRPPFLLFEPAGTTHDDRFAASRGSFVAVSFGTAAGAALPAVAQRLDRPSALRSAFRLAREARAEAADRPMLEGGAWELIAEASGPPDSHAIPPWARDAYEAVMDEAADPDLSVAGIARGIGVHPVHLARVFRRAWGCAPAELLRWRRTERAAALLADSRLAAADIAAAVGFADQSHMNRAFKACYGAAPGAWRRARHVS
ncbi:MAG TPA: helix-turn-helix domain-containing protein [Allosphingosinicella sp.]|nr:helix-turn-helix domain-containing protein [Allosphingosinicella sp.]